jgi:hypothetical protein
MTQSQENPDSRSILSKIANRAVEWTIERDEALAEGRKAPPPHGTFSASQSLTKAADNMRAAAAIKVKHKIKSGLTGANRSFAMGGGGHN